MPIECLWICEFVWKKIATFTVECQTIWDSLPPVGCTLHIVQWH